MGTKKKIKLEKKKDNGYYRRIPNEKIEFIEIWIEDFSFIFEKMRETNCYVDEKGYDRFEHLQAKAKQISIYLNENKLKPISEL